MGSGPTTTTNQNSTQKIDTKTNTNSTTGVQGTNLVQGSQLGYGQTAGQTAGITGSYQAANAYAPTQPVLQNIIGQAEALSANPGVTADQQSALSAIQSQADSNATLNPQLQEAASTMLGGAGFGDGDQYVRQGYDDLRTGLEKTAQGDYLNLQSNPYLSGMLDSSMTDAMDRIGSQFAGAGRSFSGAHRDATASAMSEAALPHLFNQYNTERNNQMSAAQALAAGGNAASGALGQNRAGAVNAMQAAPGMLDATMNPYETMLGAANQGATTAYDNLGKLNSLIMPMAQGFGEQIGLGSQAGTTSGQTLDSQQSSQLTESDILTMLDSLSKTKGKTTGTQTGTTQQQNDPLSTALGAGTMLASAWLGSDRRIKNSIEKIGETFDGQSIYRYRYNGSDAFHIGLIADEVEQVEPRAVTETSRGFKIVHYGAATERAAEMGRAL